VTEETDNVVVLHLRRFETKLDKLVADVSELKDRMTALEQHSSAQTQHLLAVVIDIANLNARQSRMDFRLERIATRLGLIEA
jgi:septal ring factor EnvC (AmiA/AmiB activator)